MTMGPRSRVAPLSFLPEGQIMAVRVALTRKQRGLRRGPIVRQPQQWRQVFIRACEVKPGDQWREGYRGISVAATVSSITTDGAKVSIVWRSEATGKLGEWTFHRNDDMHSLWRLK